MTVYSSVNQTAFAQAMEQATVLLLNAIATPTTDGFARAKDAVAKAFGASANGPEARLAAALGDMVENAATAYLCPLPADPDAPSDEGSSNSLVQQADLIYKSLRNAIGLFTGEKKP